mmetsp:Transcript_20125/g.25710  ORF Transcript_20125/g.25710 Transcript_20125/m.25710 type:complete len:328 (-) Transcript_20125:398-1381(-)
MEVSDGTNHVKIPYEGPKVRFWNSNQTFNKASTCPWAHRAEIALVAKQIPFELRIADLSKKSEEFKEVYRSISPDPSARAKVPILEILDDEGKVNMRILESEVVTKFVASTWKDRGTDLIPPTPIDAANVEIFVHLFMSQVTPAMLTLMASGSAEECLPDFKKLCKGLLVVGRWFSMCRGNSWGISQPYFLGSRYSFAECLTTPFVVRILAQINHHRGINMLETCDKLGIPELRQWIEAVRDRESTLRTTPAVQSMIQVPPYLRKVFKTYKVDVSLQNKCIEESKEAFGGSFGDSEESWKNLITEGNRLNAADKAERRLQRQQQSKL